jgi:AraC-like DNA-binding protein
LRYIEDNLGSSIANGELARHCHMSTDYFIRCFRQLMGRTPGQYIQEQRVKRAEQQLLMTSLSIEQIAADNGFGSRFYFTRVFTRHTGVSPAAYRKGLCGL